MIEATRRRLRAVSTHVAAAAQAAEVPEFWSRLEPPAQPPSDSVQQRYSQPLTPRPPTHEPAQ